MQAGRAKSSNVFCGFYTYLIYSLVIIYFRCSMWHHLPYPTLPYPVRMWPAAFRVHCCTGNMNLVMTSTVFAVFPWTSVDLGAARWLVR
ncbi:hypothetical protein B0T21DRAFT_358256 [Apiosordaria backusii]|uniref:Uncharacterized protein n=1 Tax=Apiosordaria backusii TaxID=314023 RepID=A0AA40ESK6_9PEZI|nr:hypothetical protein B0T21DRAFT_358256 [Apiosordaria backusii]